MYEDNESGVLVDSDAFSDQAIRRGFIRKIYSILSLQLMLTTAVAGLFFIEGIRLYASQNPWLVAIGIIP